MENLNDKSWYRLLKVIFIISFILTQGSAIFSAWDHPLTKSLVNCNNGKVFEYTTYDFSDSYYWDRKCDSNFTPIETGKGNFGNMLVYMENINHKIEHKTDYFGTSLMILLFALIICIPFWLISRIFFYVVVKDKFFSGRLVEIIKKSLTKK